MARAALLRFTKKTYYTHVLMLTPGEVDSTLSQTTLRTQSRSVLVRLLRDMD